jgi:hypothetical protein
MATLLTADLHYTGGPEIYSGSHISTSLSTRISIQMDEGGYTLDTQPPTQPTLLLQKLVPYGKTDSSTIPKYWAEPQVVALTFSRKGN